HGMKFGCSSPVVAARAALSETTLVKSLQPLPAKDVHKGMASDVPIGVCKEHTINFLTSWFVVAHSVVPFIHILGKSVPDV
ncbi:unnamed protein product, partial [Eruca vesicaria subsp. sativa]|nr:unnamed protein product [Eruca vesicaria subsp. sativa]